MTSLRKRIIAASIVFFMVLSAVPAPAQAATTEELQAQIAALQAQLNTLLAQLSDLGGTTTPTSSGNVPAECSGITFDRNLTVGSTGNDVKCLQALLNTDSSTKLADSGAGSPGNETSYFGNITRAAVVKFQEKYASEVLAVYGLTAGTGYFGTTSRAKANAILAAGTTEPEPVGQPSDYDNQTDCEAANYYWYNSVCNATAEVIVGDGALSVSLASDNPVAGTLGALSAYNTVLKVKATAGSEAGSVTSVTVERFGLSIDSNVSGVLVADQNGARHGNVVTLADNVTTIPFESDPINVPANSSVTFSVQVHMASTATAGTMGFKVTAMNGSPSGLPVTGNLHTLVDASGVIGTVTIDVVSQTTATVSVDIGQTDYVLTKFRIAESSGLENVAVKRMTLFQNGTAADADLQNWDLVDPNGVVLATVAQAVGKVIEFDLSNSPYTITKGTQKDLTVRLDVVSGSARTGQVIIQNDYDVQVQGVSTGLGILATAAVGGTDTAIPIGDRTDGQTGYNHLTVNAGSLTLNKSGSSPSGTFGIGASNIVVAIWELQAQGEDIQIQRADYEIGGSSASGDFTGTAKFMTEAGQTLHSQSATTADLFDDDPAANDAGDQVILSTYYTIPAGTVLKVKLVLDASVDIDDGDTIIGGLGRVYYKRMTSNTYATASDSDTHVAGNTITASAAALTVTNNANEGNTTVIEGQSGMLIGSYLLQTTSSEGVNVSSINVDITFGGAAAIGALSNLKLKRADTGAQIGSTTASPAATNTVTVSGQLNIPAATTVQVDVYADMSTATSDGGTDDTVTTNLDAADVSGVGAVSGTSITGPAAVTTGRVVTVVEGGTLTAAIETSGAAASQFLTSSTTGVEMAKIKFAATVEDMKIQRLVLRTLNGAGNMASVKLLGTGLSSDPSVPVLAGNATFTFASGGEIVIPAYGSRVVTAVVNVTGVGTTVAGNFGVLGLGTADAIGAGSGLVVQESIPGTAGTNYYVAGTNAYSGDVGDVIYFTATADAGTSTAPGFYMVTTDDDAVNLATGDLDLNGEATDTSWAAGDVITKLTKVESVLGNANAGTNYDVGEIVYVYDSDDNEAGFAIVTTAVASGSAISGLGFSPAGSITISAAGDHVTLLSNDSALYGNTVRYEEVKPTITLASNSPSGTLYPAANQTVAIFDVKADGYRDTTFDSLVLEKAGSYFASSLVKDFKLYNGATLLAEVNGLGANTRTLTDAGSSSTTVEVASTHGFDDGNTVLYIDSDTETNSGVTTVSTITDSDTIVLAADVIGSSSAATDYLYKYSVSDADTSVTSGTTYDVADATLYAVGDQLYVISATDGTDSGGATVASIGTTSIVVTQAALSGICDNAAAVANGESATIYNLTRGSDTVVFDSTSPGQALSTQTITAGATMTLTVKANTSNVKKDLTQGNVSFGVSIPGAAGPLQVGTTQVEGFRWDYTPLGTGAATPRTEADSYPVNASTLIY